MSTRSHAAFVVCLVAVAMLGGCGQRGPLYLPQDAAAKNRATLPELMTPRMPGSPDNATPAPAPVPTSAASAPGATR